MGSKIIPIDKPFEELETDPPKIEVTPLSGSEGKSESGRHLTLQYEAKIQKVFDGSDYYFTKNIYKGRSTSGLIIKKKMPQKLSSSSVWQKRKET